MLVLFNCLILFAVCLEASSSPLVITIAFDCIVLHTCSGEFQGGPGQLVFTVWLRKAKTKIVRGLRCSWRWRQAFQFSALELSKQIQISIRKELSARHVPAVILLTTDIPVCFVVFSRCTKCAHVWELRACGYDQQKHRPIQQYMYMHRPITFKNSFISRRSLHQWGSTHQIYLYKIKQTYPTN